jgi:hypothetical protein
MEKETIGRDEFLALLEDAHIPAVGGRTPDKPGTPQPPNAVIVSPSESEAEGVPSPTRPDLTKPPRPRLEPGIA